MFTSTGNKGFSITLPNGNTVSVQWGPGNYCDARSMEFDAPTKEPTWSSDTAEIAAWDSDGKWHNFGSDTVSGWLTPEEVVTFLAWAAVNDLDTSDPFAWSDDDNDEVEVSNALEFGG